MKDRYLSWTIDGDFENVHSIIATEMCIIDQSHLVLTVTYNIFIAIQSQGTALHSHEIDPTFPTRH